MASRPSSPGKIENETGDDFILGSETGITSASFTGLVTGNALIRAKSRSRFIECFQTIPILSARFRYQRGRTLLRTLRSKVATRLPGT